ncbi:MFS transporter [Phytobacter massiliensis]|uniref:MFS transporter n=1 Tax=Phytobacter massiliensis TaxID=1485952 RepID=UPI0002E747BC|nr:glycoside-pentoside-hexuronide (GPH):cation symporter [Phytobacter massiliensis]
MKKLRTTDRLAYAIGGGFSSNLGFYVMLIFFITFATDVYGINPVTVGVITLVSRLIDTFTDPLMGAIGDRTRTRFGKYRFWVLTSAPFVGITTWMVFASPELSGITKIIYMYAAYILYSIISTAANIPYHSLTAYLTNDVKERSNIVLIKQFTGLLTQFVVSAGGVYILESYSRSHDSAGRVIIDTSGYQVLGIVFGLLITLGFWVCAWGARNNDSLERLEQESTPEKTSTKDIFSQMTLAFKSRSLISLAVMSIANTLVLAMSSGITVQFFTYVLGNASYVKTSALFNVCFGAAAYLLVKILVTLYGNKKSFIYMCVLTILSSLVLYFTFTASAPLYVMIVLGLIMCFTQAASLLTWMMVTDCADEIQWRTRKNAAGIASSTLTFSNKFGSAIGAFILGYTLNAINYAPGATSQSAETISGLVFLMIITPIIGKVIALLSMYFYPLSNSYHQQIVAELNKEMK